MHQQIVVFSVSNSANGGYTGDYVLLFSKYKRILSKVATQETEMLMVHLFIQDLNQLLL